MKDDIYDYVHARVKITNNGKHLEFEDVHNCEVFVGNIIEESFLQTDGFTKQFGLVPERLEVGKECPVLVNDTLYIVLWYKKIEGSSIL